MCIIFAGKTADVAVEFWRDMVKLMKKGDQFFSEREVEETRYQEIDDI